MAVDKLNTRPLSDIFLLKTNLELNMMVRQTRVGLRLD